MRSHARFSHASRRLAIGATLALCVVVLSAGFFSWAPPARGAQVETLQLAVQADAAVANPVLNYQGRLLNPTTGTPIGDGAYRVLFHLYDDEAAPFANALWSEEHIVSLSRGVFSVLLGSVTPINQAHFTGQPLWIGVSVGTVALDPEMTPRQRIAHSAYAILAERVKDGAVTSASIADESIGAADLAAGSVGASEIGANSVDSARIADGTIGAGDIGTEQVDDARIRNTTRSITFPANALNFDKSSAVITQYHTGLKWIKNFSNAATLVIAKPPDWDGSSNVTMRLFFLFEDAGSGNAQFFIRPRSFNGGDVWADGGSNNGNTVSFTGANRFGEQTFTIGKDALQKKWWYIGIQREGASETYLGDLILESIELTYMAVR